MAGYDREAAGRRLRQVRKERLKLTGTALAKRIGTSQSFLSDVERGKSGASANLLAGLAAEFGLNIGWILHGTGPVFVEPQSTPTALRTALRHLGRVIATEEALKREMWPQDHRRDPLREIFSEVRQGYAEHGEEFRSRLEEHVSLLRIALKNKRS